MTEYIRMCAEFVHGQAEHIFFSLSLSWFVSGFSFFFRRCAYFVSWPTLIRDWGSKKSNQQDNSLVRRQESDEKKAKNIWILHFIAGAIK